MLTKRDQSLSLRREHEKRRILSETAEQQKIVFKNEEMLTGEDGPDSELRIRLKRNVSELVGEYAMLKGEARKLLKINFRQGEYVMLKREMNLIRQ